MSNYNKIIPTLAGSNLLVEAIKSKKPLIFTRIALGDGTLTESESIESLTALKHPMAQNTVQAINSRGNGEIDVVATISNASVTSGFYARELGVFAKVGDTGTEKLFAYTNAGAQASYTPAGTSLDEKLITVTFYIGNDVNVKINLNSQLYITQAALDAHNSATNAHQDAFNKKLDVTSNQYAKAIAKHNQGLQVTKGDNSQEIINFITSNYNDSDINKVLNLGTLKGLLGQGAIVASKLDSVNGYVKFVNGFIVQWGITQSDPGAGGATFNFPISFKTTNYIAIANGDQSVVNLSGIATWSNAPNYMTIDNTDSRYIGKYRVIAMGV